ncbi:MAG: LuxR family transcriptional regulator, partial [Halothiobacillaceae bacterium]
FSERERIDLEQLIPHLAEAHRICRITYMLRLDQATQKQGQALALCNPRGALIEAEAAFFKLVTREWRHWHGTTLPKELLPFLTQGQEYQGATVAITTQPVGGMLLVRLRALTVLDTLSEKQRLVALRYTQGESHRDIAQTFGLSENTVRNHIATIFKKCAVNNKSELTALIMKHRDA